MRISIWPSMRHSPAEALDVARWADARGWHGVWYADHYMPNTGDGTVADGDIHECWAMVSAIAAVTERVRIGTLVSPTSVHHPAVLANRAATIDHLSNGRMVLGLGAGWQINEHEAYGIELEAPKRRVDRFEEAIRIVRSLLDADRTTFEGEIYTITDAPANPKPIQRPLPILVGSASPRMMRITATHADEWNTWGALDGASERRAAFAEVCERAGRPPRSVWASAQALVWLDAEPASGMPSIAGSAEQLIDTLAGFEAAGFDEFIVLDANLGATPEERRDGLEAIHTRVVQPLGATAAT